MYTPSVATDLPSLAVLVPDISDPCKAPIQCCNVASWTFTINHHPLTIPKGLLKQCYIRTDSTSVLH